MNHDFETNIRNLSNEINLEKGKWFFSGCYNAGKNKILNHLNYLNPACSKHSKVYNNFTVISDFSVIMGDNAVEDF